MAERIAFFKKLSTWNKQHSLTDHRIILVGDFNTSLTHEDLSKPTKSVGKCIHKLLNYNELIDSWSFLNEGKHVPTYIDSSSKGCISRLDYIFQSNLLCAQFNHTETVSVPLVPGHIGIFVKLQGVINRGKSYWKLNTSFLEDEPFNKGIHDTVNKCINEFSESVNKRQLWDLCKFYIKKFCIKYSIKKSTDRRSQIEFIENQLKNINNSSIIDKKKGTIQPITILKKNMTT